MKIEILDFKNVNGKLWVLGKGNLLEYLRGLKTDFFEFSVQRKIVNNVYLDNIYSSIEDGEPLPPVTLTYSGELSINSTGIIDIDERDVEILDGLQRTYRLWVILYFQTIIEKSGAREFKNLIEVIKDSDEGQVILQNKFITPKFIRQLLAVKNGGLYIDYLIEKYSRFVLYFNVWSGLDDNTIIRKMLVLNAGQKSVSSTHQFELLFLHFFEDNKLHYNQAVTLIREKDRRYREVQQGRREIGEFLMSSVVIALQSYINGKQLRVASVNMINLDDNKLLNDEKLADYFNSDTLSVFINHLYDFGKRLSEKSQEYIKWYGKDTVLSGLYGAMGSFLIDTTGRAIVDDIKQITDLLLKYDDPFKLKEYYDAYENKLASSKVNVGNAVRKVIFNYTKDLLKNGQSDWYKLFSQQNNYDEE